MPIIFLTIGLPGVLVLLGTYGSPGGLGIKGAQTVKVERDRNWRVAKYLIEKGDGRTVWDWLQLVIVPATLAGFGLWFQQQQRMRDEEEKVEQRENTAIREFIQSMQPLLLDKKLKESPVDAEVRGVARALTLATLSQIESKETPDRKKLVIRFLLDSGLNSKPGNLFSLSDANLSDANLFNTNLSGANLSYANLRGVNLYLSNLRGVDLSKARLDEAYLRAADLSESVLCLAELDGANLRGANLSGANLYGADLRGADLQSITWDEKTQWPIKELFKGAKNTPPDLKKQLGLD